MGEIKKSSRKKSKEEEEVASSKFDKNIIEYDFILMSLNPHEKSGAAQRH